MLRRLAVANGPNIFQMILVVSEAETVRWYEAIRDLCRERAVTTPIRRESQFSHSRAGKWCIANFARHPLHERLA